MGAIDEALHTVGRPMFASGTDRRHQLPALDEAHQESSASDVMSRVVMVLGPMLIG